MTSTTLMKEPDFDVIIVGGGIAGLATAVALSHQGVKHIRVLEKARKFTPIGAAIGLFPNGLAALEAISPSVHRRVMESSITSARHLMMDADHENKVLQDITINVKASGHPSPQYLVWYLLQKYLAEEVPSGVLQLATTVESISVKQEDNLVLVTTSQRDDSINMNININTQETITSTISGRVLIGCDGINSIVRKYLLEGQDPELQYHNKMMFRAVLPLDSLPEGVCPPTGTSIGYKGQEPGKLFAFRETAKDIVTITAMARFDDQPIYAAANGGGGNGGRNQNLKELFSGYPKNVQTMIDAAPDSSILENGVYSIPVVDEWSKGNVVLVGDAAHAMTPGMGQGANQGLEDAIELANQLAPLLVVTPSTADCGCDTNRNRSMCTAATLPRILTNFWKGRIERVKQVHQASSSCTAAVNQATNKDSKSAIGGNDPDFLTRLYNWKPTQHNSNVKNDSVVP